MKTLIVNEHELATHWQMSDRRVRQLVGEGIAVRSGGGFDLVASDQKLINWLRRDEETLALRRAHLRQQMLASERLLQRQERQWLTLDEVQELLDRAWSRMWDRTTAVLSFVHSSLTDSPESTRTAVVSRIESLLKGELRLLQDDFAALAQRAMERFDCELRNGIFVKTREIERIEAEIGGDGRG